MSFPRSPRLVHGGLVLVDPTTRAVSRIITLQYNPDSVSRTLQARGASAETGDRFEALRLTGPPIETITLEVEIDAADQLEAPDDNPTTAELGLHPQLAALETLLYPPSATIAANAALATAGRLEILPAAAPLAVFVWGGNRNTPVRITDFSVVEQAFDPSLNPIRATVHLGLRVLTVNDLGVTTPTGSLAMTHHQRMEQLAARYSSGSFRELGIERLP
jgi:hypothetical protein